MTTQATTGVLSSRDNTIDILKGVGIILVVIGHSGCPHIVSKYIYTFHMPLFFMASGYFFSEKSVKNLWTFVKKKIKGIYLPFALCSLAFLLLHNTLFKFGLINDEYGTTTGVVSSLYSDREIVTRALSIITRMDGYENLLLGAFWFLRALFFSSLILCFGTWLLGLVVKSTEKAILIISVLCLCVAGMLKYAHFSLPYIAQGGYREMIGVFFMGAGFFLKKYKDVLLNSKLAIIFAFIISIGLFIFHPASMELSTGVIDWIIIPFSGISGTFIVFYLSHKWNSHSHNKIVAYIGRKSIWILALHLLVFKLSELIEIAIYGLPIQMIGCHPIIPSPNDWFFCIHTLVAVSIPTILAFLLTKGKAVQHINKSSSLQS